MLQLVSPRVRVFSTTGRGGDRVVFDEAAVKAKWGVEPAQIPDILALMGDSIDNIPGVPGVGEKTAAKLIGQFGGVARLYENLSLVPGKLRETLAANRKQALLSRELATVSTRVPIAVDLDAFRRREPDWDRLRALWTELEFHSLLRQLPAEPAPEATGADVPTLADAAALAAYLAEAPAGEPLAVEAIGDGGPPDPALTAIGLFHPGAGPAILELEAWKAAVPDLGGRTLVGHDIKPLSEWWLARGGTLPPGEDTAVAAYLLNPARTNYKLEEVCAELLGQGPGIARPGTRARWIWDLWAMQPRALQEVGLHGRLPGHRAAADRRCSRAWSGTASASIRTASASSRASSRCISSGRRARSSRSRARSSTSARPSSSPTILFEKLKLPPVRRTKTGYSTDADVLEQLALGHELPARIVEHRTLAKLKSTYADSLPTLINPRTGRIHTSFNQLVAATGRLVVEQSERPEHPGAHRAGPAHPGRVRPRVRAGSSSPRTTRRSSCASSPTSRGEESLIEAFRRGEDIHRRTASEVFGVRARGGDPGAARHRQDHQLRGDLRGHRLRPLARARYEHQAGAGVPRPLLRAGIPRSRPTSTRTVADGRERGFVSTLLGRRRYLPELRSGNPNLRGFAERMATNAPIQGTAADLDQDRDGPDGRGAGGAPAREPHAPAGARRAAVRGAARGAGPAPRRWPREVMESAMSLDVPLRVDVKIGADWAAV